MPKPRTLASNQTCQVWLHDVNLAQNTLLFETSALLLEAPNWSPDGQSLILNGDGTLWRLPLHEPALHSIAIEGLPPMNNDHVLDPNGTHVFMSTYGDWQIYRAELAGGKAHQISGHDAPEGLMHFLHGVSPDGKTLAFVGLHLDFSTSPARVTYAEIFTLGADGKNYRQITNHGVPVDGPEYSPDGKWIYFNTELYSGHAQIARMKPDGSAMERLHTSETVDWFPHVSPDGKTIVYLAYPTGTRGHPADLNVALMLVRDGNWQTPKPVAKLFGGQGTINVNSWSPDSRRFAYVAYPIA
jgi:TolB protein